MDLHFGPEYEAFRREVREFLRGWPLAGEEAKLPRREREARFRKRGIERGYLYREIPREYGGSAQPVDVLREHIIREEYFRAQAPGELPTQGAKMLSFTLLECGSDAQKRRYIAPALTGEEIWCQGYSEPGAGSDLASLSSRARLEGDEWVIDGHKIWTSSAHRADFMFGLFRTEPGAPKHAGISYLLIPMRSPGIEVRPLREITGGALFNEVFLTGVRIPAGNIVGKRGQGWEVSRATLKHERRMLGDPGALRAMFLELVELARHTPRGGRPALEDPVVRQRLGAIYARLQCQAHTGKRLLSENARGTPDKVALPALMLKLYGSELREAITRLAVDLLGADGLIAPDEAETRDALGATAGAWVSRSLSALAVRIAGGSSNIQRNVIAERGLGLPRDLRAR
jgi:alkylation response protein AidB-like acyl-CoA dehydrogenase